MGATSRGKRVADYYAAFKAWLIHPIFGVGLYNLEELYAFFPAEMMKVIQHQEYSIYLPMVVYICS